MEKKLIEWSDFEKIDIRVGTADGTKKCLIDLSAEFIFSSK